MREKQRELRLPSGRTNLPRPRAWQVAQPQRQAKPKESIYPRTAIRADPAILGARGQEQPGWHRSILRGNPAPLAARALQEPEQAEQRVEPQERQDER